MSVYYYMGFSLPADHDLEMKEDMVIELKDDTIESRNTMMIENVGINGNDFEAEFEFWPIQHPSEPSHEDRPVQCPMPHSSHLINDDRMQDERLSERKRREASVIHHKESNALEATQQSVRAVRKRHHDHTDTITQRIQTPSIDLHLHQKMNTAVSDKLQQVQRFES